MGTTTESIAIASVVSSDAVVDDAPLGLTGVSFSGGAVSENRSASVAVHENRLRVACRRICTCSSVS